MISIFSGGNFGEGDVRVGEDNAYFSGGVSVEKAVALETELVTLDRLHHLGSDLLE